MIFKFVPEPGFDFLNSFGKKLNVPVVGDKLTIPASLGKGSIRRINLGDIKLIVHQYKLRQEFVINRVGTETPHGFISIIFHANEEPASLSTKESQDSLSRSSEFAIQIASTDLNSVIRFPANSEIYFTVVGIEAPALRKLLAVKKPNKVLQTILNTPSGFLFYESMSMDVLKTLKQLTDTGENKELGLLYYRIKAMELLYLVFEKLQKREAAKHSPVNGADTDKLFLIRAAVLSDLSTPPRLAHLARMAGMSETKMKDLFKQVFGESIYNHYQRARMDEAAFLLRHRNNAVSEVGYRLGFTNLSHFSRVFEKYYGATPKKYSAGG